MAPKKGQIFLLSPQGFFLIEHIGCICTLKKDTTLERQERFTLSFLVPYPLQGSARAGGMVYVKLKFHQDSPPPRNVSFTDMNTRPVDVQCWAWMSPLRTTAANLDFVIIQQIYFFLDCKKPPK